MALLQVRNFSDDIYREISELAHAERRTIAKQTTLLIERGLSELPGGASERRKALERTMARGVPSEMKGIDFVSLIREDRDR